MTATSTRRKLRSISDKNFGYEIEEIVYKNESVYGGQIREGLYKVTYENGKVYVGKGPLTRARASARERSANNGHVKVEKIEWYQAMNEDDAFIKEFVLLREYDGLVKSGVVSKTYNLDEADKGLLRYSNLDVDDKKYYDDFFNN